MKRILILLIVVGTLSSFARAQTLPPVVERYEQMLVRSPEKGTAFEKVYQHFFEGDGVEKLASRWQGLAEAGGANEATYVLLRGLLADRQGRNDEAMALLERATQLKPAEFHAWLALGEVQASAGKLGPAIAAFEKALANNAPAGTRPRLFRQLARSQQRNFDTEGAIGTWQKFVAEAPDDPFVIEEAGEALAEAERFAEAKSLFEKLRDGTSSDPFQRVQAIIKLAQIEEQQGRTAQARALYEGALPLAAETSWIHREVRTRIEELFRRQDDLPGLVGYYESWLKDHGKDVEAALRLSDALIELNKKKDAVEWLRKAADWAPDRNEVKVTLAKRLGETGQAPEAVTIMCKLAQAHPEELSYLELLGESHWLVFEKSKDDAVRAAAIEQWRKLAPEDTKDSARVSRVADLLRAHQLAEPALAEYRRAIALAPTLNDLRERLIEYFFELDRDTEAWAELDALGAVEKPDLLRLARLQARHKAPDAALVSVQRGLEREPKNFDLLSYQWQLLTDAKRWPEALALIDALTETAPNAYFLEDVELRYLMALNAAEAAATFQAERVAKLGAGTLSERDLRLLARQVLSGGDLELLRKILDEGRARFPASFPLARLEVEYARRTGDLAARVQALRRLIEIQPKQKTDFLREIANAWREEARWDEALAAAQELIAATPANGDAHVLMADLLLAADRFDDGVKKLREAVKLSDNPNALRLRLSRVLLDAGDTTKAREALDEAFEAAEKPSDRLALMPQLTEAYFIDGKLETLIERFRQRQRAEDEGWRYALYLADIFKQTLDFASARRELARALAARPKDSGLLRQMVRLADEEKNAAEVARYQAALTEAEPSDANQIALIEALYENDQAEPAFALLQRQFPAVNRTANAWDRLLPFLSEKDQLGRLAELLATQPGGKSAIETRLQLAVIKATDGNSAAARELFWSIFATKTPPMPPAPEKPDPALIVGGYQMTPFDQRLASSYQTRQAVQRIVDSNRYGGSISFSGSSGVTPAKVDPSDIARDNALLYLAAFAVKESRVPQFLEELEKQLAARDSTRSDRLLAYGIVQAREPLLREIRRQVNEPAPDPRLDSFCLGQLMMLVQNPFFAGEKVDLDKAEVIALYDALKGRVVKANTYPASVWDESEVYFYQALAMPEKVKAIRQQILATVDLTKPEKAVNALGAAIGEGDLAKLKQIVAALVEAGRKKPNSTVLQQLQWLPLSLFNRPGEGPGIDDKVRVQMLGELLAAWYPTSAPRPSLGSSQNQRFFGNDEEALPPTRFIDTQRMHVLQSLASQLNPQARQGSPVEAAGMKELRGILETQAQTLPEAQRIFPQLVLIHLDAWAGKNTQAVAAAQTLLAAQPDDDDLRLLTGALLGRGKKYPEALAILRQISPRLGSANVELQKQLLAYAKLGNDTDTARKAALRLASLRLTPEERSTVAADLRALGLTERASQLSKQATAPSSSRGNSSNASYETYQKLRKLLDEKKEEEALAVARQVVTGDPMTFVENQYFFDQALRAFQTFGKLDALMEETAGALQQTPDSLRLNFLLAAGSQLREAPGGTSIQGPAAKLPCWLKLERRDGKISGFHSTDGEKWTRVGSVTAAFPESIPAGLVLVGREKELMTSADFSNVTFNGIASATTGESDALPTPWEAKDIGKVQKPGAQTFTGDHVQLRAGGGWIGFDADALHFVHQPLAGDGTLAVALKAAGDGKGFGEAGIMLRATHDPKSNNVALVAVPGQPVRFKYRQVDGSAEKYWRKVVEIRPGEKKFQQLLASWLVRIGKNDEAFAIYSRLFDSDPELVFESANDLVSLYKSGKRLEELANRAASFQPPANGNQDWSFGFYRIAEALQQEKRPELVEKVAKRGLELISYDNGEMLTRLLASAQKALGKPKESIETIMAYFSSGPAKEKPAAGTQLGFQTQRYIDPAPRWQRSLSISEDQISLGGLALIDSVQKEGQLAELTRRLAAEPGERSAPDKALLAFLGLKARDPAALDAIRLCVDGNSRVEQAVSGILLEAAREMKAWPGKEAVALELYRGVRMQVETEQFLRWGRNQFLTELAITEEQLGDRALPETLRALTTSIEEDDAMRGTQNRREFRWRDAGICLGLLLHAGMETEYVGFLEKMKKTPEGPTIGWTFDEERKLFRAEKVPQAMVWLNDPLGGATVQPAEVAFELRVEHPYDHGDVYKFMASRLRSIAAMEKERTLKFYYGRTRDALQPLGELVTKSARGTWRGEVPAGLGWMRIGIVDGGAEALSPMVPVCRGKNLIANAGFEGLANRPAASAEFDLDGWKKLPPGFWKNGTGGPRGDGFVQCEARGERQLIGQRIPLEKGRIYQQSGWVRALGEMGRTAEIGRRYLDASGAVVKTTFFPGFASFNWRWHAQRFAFEGGADTEQIPANAAFLEPIIKVTGGAEWAGLFFGTDDQDFAQ